jgi:hypothetical protein
MAEHKSITQLINVPQLIKDLKELGQYSIRDRAIYEWNERIKDCATDLHALFGIRIAAVAEKAISNIGSILRLCGFSQKKTKHAANKNGDRTRYYQLINPSESIIRIWIGWLKDADLNQRKKEVHTQFDEVLKAIFMEFDMEMPKIEIAPEDYTDEAYEMVPLEFKQMLQPMQIMEFQTE